MRAGAGAAAAKRAEPPDESEEEDRIVEGFVRPTGGERIERWARWMEGADWGRERKSYVCGVDEEVEEIEGEEEKEEEKEDEEEEEGRGPEGERR